MNEIKQIKFKGKIKRCVFNSESFKVYAFNVDIKKYPEVQLNSYKNCTIIGDLPDLVDDIEYEITAVEKESKYGLSYQVLNIRRDIPTTSEEVYSFLSSILTVNQAKTICEAYPNILEIIKENRLDEIDLSRLKGIKEYTFERIREKIIDNFYLADLIAEFQGYFTLSIVRKLYKTYTSTDKVKEVLRHNPYSALTKISGVGFKTADRLLLDIEEVSKNNIKKGEKPIIEFEYDIKTSKQRCLACMLYLLKKNEDNGNTKMNLVDLRSECLKMANECIDHFPEAVKNEDIYLNKEKLEIALKRTYNTEKFICDNIKERLKNNNNVWSFNTEFYRNINGVDLSDEQMGLLRSVCNNNFVVLTAPAGCVDCDTEFFDGTKWKRIADYQKGDKVLQYNKDGVAELVYPERYIKNEADYLWHFKTKYGLDQCLSDNHNCYYITSRGNLYNKPFKEVRKDQENNGFSGRFITTFNYSGDGIGLSDDEIRLMIATFADGSFCTKEDGKQPNRSRFHIKKDRKKERLMNLATSTGCYYRTHNSVEEGYVDFYIDVPFRSKHFPAEWYNCNKHQLQIIASEVMFWDGDYKKNNCFSTSNKEDADFIQFVFSSLGYRATISTRSRVGQKYETCGKLYYRKSVEYVVNYTKRTLIGFCIDNCLDHIKTKIEPYKTLDGYEYCFTVPSHMLVLRRNDKIFITGNCGKSFSAKALINLLKDNHKSFIQCAPTGKAAKKLSQYTGEQANTIHRTLAYREGSFVYNRDNKLFADVVLVDEVGMTDIYLFKSLLEAIDIDTKIVLIGDSYQLNSVGCGALLRDLCSSEKIPHVTFNKVFRMGEGGVLTACTYVRQNKKFLSSNAFTQIGEDKSYSFIPSDKTKMNDMILALYKKLLETNDVEDITVISSYNIGENGCDKLNQILQPIANPSSLNSDRFIKIIQDKLEIKYYVGDMVIQCSNNYRAKLFLGADKTKETTFLPNGAQGKIIDIIDNDLIIKFDDAIVYYSTEEIRQIRHAFALSTHRMQGSQNKIIIFCCPSSHIFFLSNNIIYTAISRAEQKVFHFSDVRTINTAMNKSDSNKRNTFLGDMLKNFL